MSAKMVRLVGNYDVNAEGKFLFEIPAQGFPLAEMEDAQAISEVAESVDHSSTQDHSLQKPVKVDVEDGPPNLDAAEPDNISPMMLRRRKYVHEERKFRQGRIKVEEMEDDPPSLVAESVDSSSTRNLRTRNPVKVEELSPEVKKESGKNGSPSKKAPPRKPRETRKEQKKEGQKKREVEENPQGVKFDIHAKTYTVPPRKIDFLHSCFMCDDDGSKLKLKIKKEVKDEPLDDKVEEKEEQEMKEEEVKKEDKEAKKGEKRVKKEEKEKTEEVDGSVKAEAKKEEDEYVKCSFKNCMQRMHTKCAKDYNCSEYSPGLAQLLFFTSGPVCPAHFCWHCYEERGKNTARFGELIDCEQCMRTFHLDCMPAGCKIKSTSGRRKTFICHEHTSSTGLKITPKMRLRYCTECEQEFEETKGKDEKKKDNDPNKRMECKKCTCVFHRKCAIREVKGPGSEDYKYDTCPSCLIGLTIVSNQYVLAYISYKSFGLAIGYYPAIAMAVGDIPDKVKKDLGSNLGRTGYIPIKWMWSGLPIPYYNVIHKSQVHRMTIDCGKNLADPDWAHELKIAAGKFTAPIRAMDHDAMRKTIVRLTENACSKATKAALREKTTLYECDCKPDKQGLKCNTVHCLNRQMHQECTKMCDENEGITCANRAMQREERPEDMYEVRVTDNGKGLGVFATRNIKPLEFLFEYAGEVIDAKEKDRRNIRKLNLRANDEWTYVMGLGKRYFVDARFKGSDARYVNHSCDPNAEVFSADIPVKVNNEEVFYEPKLKVQTMKAIKEGEEITFDYDLEKSRGLAVDKCLCGSDNCIGKLGKKTKKGDTDVERFGDASEDEIEVVDEEEEMEDSETEEEKENKRRKRKMQREASMKRKSMKKEKEETKDGVTMKRRASARLSMDPSTSRGPPKRSK